MILLRFKSNKKPKDIFYGDEKTMNEELNKRKLTHIESIFYCNKKEINNLKTSNINTHEFYVVCENSEDLNKQIIKYNNKFKLKT